MTFPVTDIEALRNVAPGTYAGREEYGSTGLMTEIGALIEADRVAYGARFQTLCGELRDPDRVGGSGAVVAVDTGVVSAATVDWRGVCYGLCVRLAPDVLPGSEQSTESTGGTAATRGALRLWTWSSGAEWYIRVRLITVDGADSAIIGTATTGSIAAAAPMAWRSVDVLLPLGTVPGDDIAIDVYYRSGNDLGGGVFTCTWRAWSVLEPDLTAVDEDPDVSIRAQTQLSDYVDVSLSAATLTAIPVTAWDAVGTFRTAYLIAQVVSGTATVQVLKAGTAQTTAPLSYQVPTAGMFQSPQPLERSTHELYSATACTVRVWWNVVTGAI